MSKTFKTLKGHLKSKRGRHINGPGERPHSFQKSHKKKITASLLKCLFRQGLVTKNGVFEEDDLISTVRHSEKIKTNILSSDLTFYTSSIISGKMKALLQHSQVQELIAVVSPHLFF